MAKKEVIGCLEGLFVTTFIIFSVILYCSRKKKYTISSSWSAGLIDFLPNSLKPAWARRARFDSIEDAWSQSLVATQVEEDEEEYTIEFLNFNDQPRRQQQQQQRPALA